MQSKMEFLNLLLHCFIIPTAQLHLNHFYDEMNDMKKIEIYLKKIMFEIFFSL